MDRLANPRQERRKAPRHQLKEILYINLEHDNGGIVVDLSEDGLSFRCAIPIPQALRPDEPIQVSLVLPHGQQIRISAVVVWTGQTRKTGGLRFTNLSVVTRAQILSLIGESSASASSSHVSTPTQPLTADMPHLSPPPSQLPRETQKMIESQGLTDAQKLRETPKLPETQKLAEEPKAADVKKVAETTPLPVRPFPISESYYPRAKDSWLPPEQEPRSFRGAAVALFFIALFAGAGWLIYSYRMEVGAQMVKWGEQLQGASQAVSQPPQQSPQSQTPPSTDQSAAPTQTAAAAPQPALSPAEAPAPLAAGPSSAAPAPPETPGSANASAPAKTTKSPASPHQPSRVAQPLLEARASDSPDKRSASDKEDAAADVAAAQRYLEGKEQTRNSAAAAQLLWAAVAKGDPTAETTLARLYLDGDGVTRSCEQARVLLKAASDHGDSQAEETLAQVGRTRCR